MAPTSEARREYNKFRFDWTRRAPLWHPYLLHWEAGDGSQITETGQEIQRKLLRSCHSELANRKFQHRAHIVALVSLPGRNEGGNDELLCGKRERAGASRGDRRCLTRF